MLSPIGCFMPSALGDADRDGRVGARSARPRDAHVEEGSATPGTSSSDRTATLRSRRAGIAGARCTTGNSASAA
jgi:hypothetical protein